jgi:hypothetical protein
MHTRKSLGWAALLAASVAGAALTPAVAQAKKAKVSILLGQSNMVGRGGGMSVLHNEWLKVGKGKIGIEIGAGHELGEYLDEPVLLLKSCIGNRALGWDLLPPGADGYEVAGFFWW